MDLGTAMGLLAGLLCIVWSIASAPGGAGFIHIPAMLITLGGMTAATFIHFTLKQMIGLFSVFKKTLFCKQLVEQELIQKVVNYAAINRRDGALALEKQLSDAGDSFLVTALRMVIDGQQPEVIEEQLGMEIQYLQERHADGKRMLEFMGSAAPAWGMIGTLIGLIQMLRALDNPSNIGQGMAIALLTTFYGAFMANLVFLPMAGKLGIRSKKEATLRQMISEAAMALARGDSPTAVRERMQTFVSAKQRGEFKPRI
ncbi:MAG TPA: MotA/TolQ/ExbB proton channel family protein [Phycisphaerae bacterium]|nr:MotA/TolQ/ExbB proton channel family protein [Phycisphaerae bacterium]